MEDIEQEAERLLSLYNYKFVETEYGTYQFIVNKKCKKKRLNLY